MCNCKSIVELVGKNISVFTLILDFYGLLTSWKLEKKKSDYFVGWFYYLQALVPTNICSTIYYSLVESILSYGIILNMGCGA